MMGSGGLCAIIIGTTRTPTSFAASSASAGAGLGRGIRHTSERGLILYGWTKCTAPEASPLFRTARFSVGEVITVVTMKMPASSASQPLPLPLPPLPPPPLLPLLHLPLPPSLPSPREGGGGFPSTSGWRKGRKERKKGPGLGQQEEQALTPPTPTGARGLETRLRQWREGATPPLPPSPPQWRLTCPPSSRSASALFRSTPSLWSGLTL